MSSPGLPAPGERRFSALDELWGTLLKLPLPLADFERLPRHPGYRYEYVDGQAELSARPWYVNAVLSLADASAAARPSAGERAEFVRPLAAAEWADLIRPMTSAFQDHPPFGLLPPAGRQVAAQRLLERTRAGQDGAVFERASFVVTGDAASNEPVGAALVTLVDRQRSGSSSPGATETGAKTAPMPHLTWIFVQRWEQRRGLGTVLLDRVVRELCAAGYTELASTVMVGNTVSLLWHWRRGFRLLGWHDTG